MKTIKLRSTETHNTVANYTIEGNLIILVQDSLINDKCESSRIGMSIDEFIGLSEMIKTKKFIKDEH